jgi:hypothetical protein
MQGLSDAGFYSGAHRAYGDNAGFYTVNFNVMGANSGGGGTTSTPQPSSLMLIGTGLLGLESVTPGNHASRPVSERQARRRLAAKPHAFDSCLTASSPVLPATARRSACTGSTSLRAASPPLAAHGDYRAEQPAIAFHGVLIARRSLFAHRI